MDKELPEIKTKKIQELIEQGETKWK